MLLFRIGSSVQKSMTQFCAKNEVYCSWKEFLSTKATIILPFQKAHTMAAETENPVPVKRKSLRRKVNPQPVPNLIKAQSKILGVHMRQNILSWAVVQGDTTIKDWNCIHLPNELPVQGLYDVIKMASTISNSLEACDIYVMEEPESMRTSKKAILNLQMQINQVYVIIMSHFLQREKTDDILNDASSVYIMRSGTTAQQFSLRIGSDILTTNYVIEPMLSKILIDHRLRKQYTGRENREREEMNWALLKTLAFLQICNDMKLQKTNQR